jgi:hypothetical protein
MIAKLKRTSKVPGNPELIKKELILALRQERRIKEISQEDLANMAGVHRNYRTHLISIPLLITLLGV